MARDSTLESSRLDNWKYRDIVPTEEFNGQLALIRELRLQRYPEGERLTQVPVAEYQQLRTPIPSPSTTTVRDGEHLLADVNGDSLELHLTFDVGSTSAAQFGVNLRQGDAERTVVGYDLRQGQMFVDRSGSGAVPVRDDRPIDDLWVRRYGAHLPAEDGLVRLRIFVDRSSVEVTGNDKEQISCLVLPRPDSTAVSVYADGGTVQMVDFQAFKIGSIY